MGLFEAGEEDDFFASSNIPSNFPISISSNKIFNRCLVIFIH